MLMLSIAQQSSGKCFCGAVDAPKALFACLIIRTFRLIFSARTVFFSHNKSVEAVFQFVFSAKQTGPFGCAFGEKKKIHARFIHV